MTTSRRWIWLAAAALLVGCLIAPVGASRAFAEDEEEEAKPAPLSVRIYRVGALTQPRYSFSSDFAPVQEPTPAHRRGGSEPEEGQHPLGGIDEVIEILKSRVSPVFWEVTDGADMAAMGEQMLVVRADGAVHAELARELANLERRTLRTVSVDVCAVRLDDKQLAELNAVRGGARLDDDVVAALLANEEVAGPATRVTTENGVRAETFGGRQRAFLRRHTAVIREGTTIELPVAGVTNTGLNVSLEPIVHADGETIRLELQATLTERQAAREVKAGSGHTVQLPATPGLFVKTEVLLTPGAWGLAHATSGGWSLLVRATPSRTAGLSRRATAISLDAPLDPRPGAMEVRDFDVASLSRAFTDVRGWGGYLYDTSWEGPRPRELGEPSALVPAESLVELLMHSIGSASHWEDPATIEARNGILIVRQTKPILAAIDGWLGRLRQALPTTFATTVELVSVTPALQARLTDPARGSGWLLDAEERAVLQAALDKEDAWRLGTTRLTQVDGVRNAVRSGRTLRYVSTYTTAVPAASTAVLPKTAEVLEGLEVDARVTASPGGDAVLVALRAMRTDARGQQPSPVATKHGTIELPALDTLRLRSNLTVPLGGTAVAGVLPRGDRQVLVLVTVMGQPRGR